MSAATDLLSGGQRFLAGQFPGTIVIAGQTYACATSGPRTGFRHTEGGAVQVREMSFWLVANAFASAGADEPKAGETLTHNDLPWVIDSITAAGATTILRAVSPQ